jgi:hypothetical protein
MTDPSTPRENSLANPAVLTYFLVCVSALLVIVLLELERGFDLFIVLPLMFGGIGLLLRSGLASLMLVLALAGKIILTQKFTLGALAWGKFYIPRFRGASDMMLAGAVLAYVMAHCRLTGLARSILPSDPRYREPRPRRDWFGGTEREIRQYRTPALVGPVEWALFLVALPVWGLLGQLVWLTFPGTWTYLELPPWVWRLIVPAWVLATVLILASSFLGYWGRRNMTAREGQLLLQDVLWHDTRREQRSVNRWLAWDRKRRDERKEPT